MNRPDGADARTTVSGLQRAGYIIRSLRLIWDASKGWTVFWACLLLLQGLLPAAVVYLTKTLVDGVAGVIGAGVSWEAAQPVIIPALLMGVVLIGTQVLTGLLGWIRTAQTELIKDHIKGLIHRKASAVDLEFYETPEYFDDMWRANWQAEPRINSILMNLGNIGQNSVSMLAIAMILIPYSAWLPFILLVSTLPALFVVVRHSRRYYKWWEETTEYRRWTDYFDLMLTDRHMAQEVRLFGLAEYFQSAYRTFRKTLRDRTLRFMRAQTTAQVGAGFIALLVTVGTMLWIGMRAMRGAASLGDIALFYQAFNQGQALMRTLLNSGGHLYADTLFLQHLFRFLDLQPKIVRQLNAQAVPVSLRNGIEIKNASFRYPGSENLALSDFSLFIPAGKTAAIVGANGAGKSTLIKLICRFYDPEQGSVLLDGVDIRNVDVDELWRRITVIFQHPVRYSGPLADSIALGDLRSEATAESLERAAAASGADEVVEGLPRRFDTLLGKQFRGGTDLSGGQWQRLALARAFYRQAPIMILDEPTSFMDSWAETLWLNRFKELAKGKTAVLVTHRFTTAMRADIIHVMDAGRVIESGTHAELLNQKGVYAESWLSQMRASYSGDAGAPESEAEIQANGRG